MAREMFAEEAHIMKALYQDYTKRTELDAIANTDQDLAEICETCSAREQDVRETIREEQYAQIDEQLRTAVASDAELSASSAAEEALIRHQLSMYAHITRITWRLDKHPHVAGTVSDTKSGDIRHFSFDPASNSQFELVNALWELL